ncbi:TetR family transcriptional regulator [Nocardia sp. R7R-8]|uniref:TetR family transcriptional regulator n=1 Tax=Nocardia sp. R7R-8 TaxID=3459304 RepID=UPI00403DEA26
MRSTDAAEPVPLRTRTRRIVRSQVAQIGLDLILEKGFDQTTVEDIAKAAGTSRATVFRYFATKEDIVLETLPDIARQSLEILVARPRTEQPWTSLRHALQPAVRERGSDLAIGLRTAQVIIGSPTIRARLGERSRAWRDLLVPEMTRRLDSLRNEQQRHLAASAMVASALACLQVALETWLHSGGEQPLAAMLDCAMDAVRPGASDRI